ncbi:U3 small nucleolar ribonucleoprotein MPP10 [Habropoda laboriosa]|uniref:U3 small nucleolar ribonucleoprotein protein MPP10 n=1 Tax=Habropoda laboriosa TaxID=597456 RepID=A0A0L7R336_9HYME|nr:PREDICTED: U3 small nucleolar ribonucleoprotein protein MPP10 [Habropoda laboriosa]KOC65287.1 U3 small nucleolar ribonucleoprotein MPP10 [Habropoda laboriosa]
MADIEILNNVIHTVDNNTKKPEQFLSVQNDVALDFRKCTKRLYDFTKEQSKRNTNALPELVTEGFDEEQIWQQLELQNEGELDHLINSVSKALAESKKLIIPINAVKPKLVQNNKEDSSEEEKEENQEEEEEDDLELKISGEESSEDEIKLRSSLRKENVKNHKKKSSIVDDKFFKLEELDEYLTKEDKKEKQSAKNEVGSDDESLDLFNDLSGEDNTEEAKLVKYADFFDNPQSEDENHNDSVYHKDKDGKEIDDDESLNDDGDLDNEMEVDSEEQPSKKKVTFNLTNDSDETDSIENKNTSVKEDTQVKSTLETRQERLKKRIEQLEQEAIAEKPWQLKGEVSGTRRPRNSLLEEFVEFDITTRPPPVITEQTTLKLEDIIKQRIKDKAWDDVEKKFKPVETPLEYKKKLILNQEKSKESLSQIYENEYLKQKQSLNPDDNEKEEEEPPLHIQIRQMMHSVFSKLNALSNYHYTPKMAKPEMKIVTNIPAINMEEVAPVGMSDATLLAPEEIKAKPRGDLIGKAERTKTDMKRQRRRKKIKQRARQQAIEEKEKLIALKPGVAKKYKKEKAAQLAKKLSNNRNIIQMDETGVKAPKSSTAFFNQLQEEVKSHIKTKIGANKKKKEKNTLSAVKLKL